jgi:hypothetical protein
MSNSRIRSGDGSGKAMVPAEPDYAIVMPLRTFGRTYLTISVCSTYTVQSTIFLQFRLQESQADHISVQLRHTAGIVEWGRA